MRQRSQAAVAGAPLHAAWIRPGGLRRIERAYTHAKPAPSMFSQKLIHEGARRVARPLSSWRMISGLRQVSYGISQKSSRRRHLLKGSTAMPRKAPPPPHIEWIVRRTPRALSAAISLWRNISVGFGKVVNRY